MKRWAIAAIGFSMLFVVVFPWAVSSQDEQPGKAEELRDIKRIMKLAHLTPQNRGTRNNLDNKVLDGKATDGEKKELLKLYTALAKATPSAGKLDDWKSRTEELVGALKAVYNGEDQANQRFIKAKDCKACHELHRK
jgi:hypothetical protein